MLTSVVPAIGTANMENSPLVLKIFLSRALSGVIGSAEERRDKRKILANDRAFAPALSSTRVVFFLSSQGREKYSPHFADGQHGGCALYDDVTNNFSLNVLLVSVCINLFCSIKCLVPNLPFSRPL